jgi:tRNA dimethylallyltransferase
VNDTSSQTTNQVIVILGPTGVGKTPFSIQVAKALNTEIISADSMQVYRHMDIGTAKPSHRELREVKHHLIDILAPGESFSAGKFREMAAEIIEVLHGRNKIPVIAGGTGLYIKTLTKGLFEGPEADWDIRNRLLQEEKHFGTEYIFERLRKIDPLYAEKINPNDSRRIIRAMEVSLKSGKTITEAHRSSTIPLDCNFIKIGLARDRKELYEIIEKRVDSMMKKGLVGETRKLLRTSPVKAPLQALGYKEILLYLSGNAGIEDAVRLIKKRSKMFARRQLTWFRKEPGVLWVDISGIMEPENIFKKALQEVEILREIIYGKNGDKCR